MSVIMTDLTYDRTWRMSRAPWAKVAVIAGFTIGNIALIIGGPLVGSGVRDRVPPARIRPGCHTETPSL